MKEVIILDAGNFDDDPYIHSDMYEKYFDYIDGETLSGDKADHYMVILFTKNNFSGKIKMTLESIEDGE